MNHRKDTPADAHVTNGLMSGLVEALRVPRSDSANESALVSLIAQLQHLNGHVQRISASIESQTADVAAIRQLLESARDAAE